MTTAEKIADKILALINSRPRSPTREEMVDEVAATMIGCGVNPYLPADWAEGTVLELSTEDIKAATEEAARIVTQIDAEYDGLVVGLTWVDAP